MKPNFALNLTHENIGLLHRTARGWLEVGAASLDDPEMGEALNYLRRSALGLAPHGVATKLVIPNSQLLYFETEAPGPDNTYRRAQIRRALEGRTPYPVEDLVFDWSGDGPVVKVAACARETLFEAEQFAAQYRFNPVSFVAIPEAGQFDGEPWFGPTSIAAQILPSGETVERDDDAVHVVTREPIRAEAAPVPPPMADPPPAPRPAPLPEIAAIPEEGFDPADEFANDTPELEPEAEHEPEIAQHTRVPAADTPTPAPAAVSEQMSFADVLNAQIIEADAAPVPQSTPQKPAISVTVNATAFSSRRATEPLDELPPALSAAVMGLRATATRSDPSIAARAARITPTAASDDMALDASPDDMPPLASDSPPEAAFDAKSIATKLRLSVPPRPVIAAAAKPAPVAKPARAAAKPVIDAAIGKATAKAKELKALIALPAFAGGDKNRAKTLIAPPPSTATAANTIAARGKLAPREATPKYLGLILTAILLVFLLVVAIWSSYTVAGLFWGQDPEVATLTTEADAATDANAPPITAPVAVDIATQPADPVAAQPDTVAAPADGVSGLAQDQILLSGVDTPPTAGAAVAPPQVTANIDALPDAGLPPPPFGTQYEFEANGQVKPTAAGVVTPDGVRVIAGRPPVVPGPRPASLAPPVTAEIATTANQDVATAQDGVATVGADPALAAFRPKPRPAGITPAAPIVAAEATPGASASLMPQDAPLPADGVSAVGADPALAGFRPKSRPAGLTPPPAPEAAAPTPVADPRLASARPRARPATVAALAEAARAATAAASLSASAAAAAEPQTEALAQTSPMAVAISRKPQARPRNLANAVEAAVAAAVRQPEVKPEPEPEPAPEPEQVAAAKPVAKPVVKPAAEAKPAKPGLFGRLLKPTAPEADDEPEIAPKAPSSPSKGVVAKQATFANAINLSKTNLIGVYGTASKRYALIRTPQGRYKKVKVGDTVDGGKVAAILDGELRYQKGGRILALTMPKS